MCKPRSSLLCTRGLREPCQSYVWRVFKLLLTMLSNRRTSPDWKSGSRSKVRAMCVIWLNYDDRSESAIEMVQLLAAFISYKLWNQDLNGWLKDTNKRTIFSEPLKEQL